MNLFGVIVLTLLIYLSIKLLKYNLDRAFKDGYKRCETEIEYEAEEIFEKIKEINNINNKIYN